MKKIIDVHNQFSTYTNLIYGLIGIICAVLHGWSGFILACTLVYLMIGSGIYHYYERHEYVLADWSAMYFTFSAFIFTFLYQFGIFHPSILINSLVLGLLLTVMHNRLDKKKLFDIELTYYIVGLLYSSTLILSFFILPFVTWVISGICFLIAFYIRQIGQTKYYKNTDEGYKSHDRLHSAWHILTGIGMFFYLLY